MLEYGTNLFFDGTAQLFGLAELTTVNLILQMLKDFLRSLYAQVRHNKGCFQRIQDILVNGFLAFDDRLNTLDQLFLGGSDGLLKPVEESTLLLLFLFWRTEQSLNHALFYPEPGRGPRVAPGDFGSTFLSKPGSVSFLTHHSRTVRRCFSTIEHDEKKDASRSPRFTFALKREP